MNVVEPGSATLVSGPASKPGARGKIIFPANWQGFLPPPVRRRRFRKKYADFLSRHAMAKAHLTQFYDFLERYERRYYECKGTTYHRRCGGGAMAYGKRRIHCSNCGRLKDLLPPTFVGAMITRDVWSNFLKRS